MALDEIASEPTKYGTPGDRVVVRATTCTIAGRERFGDCERLRLEKHFPSDTPFGALLVPFDRPRLIVDRRWPQAMRPRAWLHALRGTAAEHHPFGALRRAAGARIELLPYQLEPALATLRHGHLRVLIADAVGLGKTIQAGLVLAEVSEDVMRRALILTPAGLRHQWQVELAEHFRIEAALCDADWLRHRVRDLPLATNPWTLPGVYIASFDFIKRPEVLKPVEQLLWDVVIIDEAHLVTAGTDRRAAVDAIASRSRRVLLLTATPHSGDDGQFEALCRIGEGRGRTPVVMFRRARSDVGITLPRRSVLLRVRLTDAERRMHDLLDRYVSRLWREAQMRHDQRARLVAIVLRKRSLSSAGSLAASLARRLDLLSRVEAPNIEQLPLPLSQDDEGLDDRVPDEVLATPGLGDSRVEQRWLAALLETARHAARGERKAARLRRLLTLCSEPAIVFTEYRDTLGRLQQALATHALPVLTLHGGLTAAARRDVQRTFNEQPSLLLATDAAAEGLNLQRCCRLVIHFELPWNPLRLEQRVGRVDRIGQTKRVHEIALVADATVERTVLAPLARRAAKARALSSSSGRMWALLDEWHVAEAVMSGDARSPLADHGRDQSNLRVNVERTEGHGIRELRLPGEAEHEAARLSSERRWRGGKTMWRRKDGPMVTALRQGGAPQAGTLTVVYVLSALTADARVIHSELFAVAVALRSRLGSLGSTSATTGAVQRLISLAQPHLDALIATRVDSLRAELVPLHRALVTSMREREIAIAGWHRSAAREIVQAGLFDRRDLRDAEIRKAVCDRRNEEAEERLTALTLTESVTYSTKLHGALIRTG